MSNDSYRALFLHFKSFSSHKTTAVFLNSILMENIWSYGIWIINSYLRNDNEEFIQSSRFTAGVDGWRNCVTKNMWSAYLVWTDGRWKRFDCLLYKNWFFFRIVQMKNVLNYFLSITTVKKWALLILYICTSSKLPIFLYLIVYYQHNNSKHTEFILPVLNCFGQ